MITLKRVFYLYITILLLFVIIKFDGTINSIVNNFEMIRANREMGVYNFNIIPLRSLISNIESIIKYSDVWAIKSFSANIIAFIPWGIMIPLLHSKFYKIINFIFVSILFLFLIETFQFITMTGYFDIDDIILNIIGSIIGFIFLRIYLILKKLSIR